MFVCALLQPVLDVYASYPHTVCACVWLQHGLFVFLITRLPTFPRDRGEADPLSAVAFRFSTACECQFSGGVARH